MDSETVGAWVMGIITVIIVSWGVAAQKQLDSMPPRSKAAPEFITTQGLVAPRDYQEGTTGRYATISTYWATMETDDWVLLNGPRGTATCQEVLGQFGYDNANAEVMTSAQAQVFASGVDGKSVELQVLIPRFENQPAKLSSCLGFGYDSFTKTLTVGSKHVAYLAYSQPRLGNTDASHDAPASSFSSF